MNAPPKTVFQPLKGFTLVELLIGVSILSLFLIAGLPSLRTLLLNSRVTASVDSLVNVFNYARETALSTNSSILVCPLATPNSTACGTNWSNGWIALTQPPTGTATLVKSIQNTMGPSVTANVNSVTFNSHGVAINQSNFTFCDNRGSAWARSVEVMATGFIQAGATVGQAVWNNTALTCP